MQRARTKATAGGEVQHYGKGISLRYPHRLNFYDKPPIDDVTIEDFETWALDRLRILAEIESSFARNRQPDELARVTLTQAKKYLPLSANTATTLPLDEQRTKDHVSHFVLRLAFCRSEDLRRRFVKAESALFRARWDENDAGERKAFLESRSFNSIPVTDEEKKQYKDKLKAIAVISNDDDFKKETFYKVKKLRVLDLLGGKRVFMKDGWVYLPSQQQSSIVFQEFALSLDRALQLTAKALPRLDEDTRLMPLLNNLSQGFLAGVPSEWSGADSTGPGDEIKAEMVDDLARKHFPMCMRNLHDNLRRDKHLKHYGRLQYGLFLKALGLSIEEALIFWRRSFSNLSDDKFNKEYKYNIRHSFGLEGKRANYPAWSCQQILMQNQPSSQDNHGCPYRHFELDNLQTALISTYGSQGLTSSDLPEIVSTVKGKHFHVACTRVYEITHSRQGIKKGDGLSGDSVTHPNQYATKSRELEREVKKEPGDDMVVE